MLPTKEDSRKSEGLKKATYFPYKIHIEPIENHLHGMFWIMSLARVAHFFSIFLAMTGRYRKSIFLTVLCAFCLFAFSATSPHEITHNLGNSFKDIFSSWLATTHHIIKELLENPREWMATLSQLLTTWETPQFLFDVVQDLLRAFLILSGWIAEYIFNTS